MQSGGGLYKPSLAYTPSWGIHGSVKGEMAFPKNRYQSKGPMEASKA